jgi:hypothetical protein
MSLRPAAIIRLLVVVAAGFALALLWSLYEGKRAHALDVPAPAPLNPSVQIAPVLPSPVAQTLKPVANATGSVTKPAAKVVALPVANNVTKPLTPIVQPVVDVLKPIVQPVVDTVAPVVRPALHIVTRILPAPPSPPVLPVQDIAPRGPSAAAVANIIATAVAQVAGDATSDLARRFTSAVDGIRSLPHPNLAMPVLPLPALPVSFPSPVPLSHAPGGLGRTSGGGLAVLLAAAAVASLRGRRVRFATGVGQSLFLASLIERPG